MELLLNNTNRLQTICIRCAEKNISGEDFIVQERKYAQKRFHLCASKKLIFSVLYPAAKCSDWWSYL